MDATFLIFAMLIVAFAAAAFMAGRRGRGSTDEDLNCIIQAQSELSGRMQQSESSLNERLDTLTKRLGDGLV